MAIWEADGDVFLFDIREILRGRQERTYIAVYIVLVYISSGKRSHNYGTSPCYQWEKSFFLWSISANC